METSTPMTPGTAQDTLDDELSSFVQQAQRGGRRVVLMTFSSMPVGERTGGDIWGMDGGKLLVVHRELSFSKGDLSIISSGVFGRYWPPKTMGRYQQEWLFNVILMGSNQQT